MVLFSSQIDLVSASLNCGSCNNDVEYRLKYKAFYLIMDSVSLDDSSAKALRGSNI